MASSLLLVLLLPLLAPHAVSAIPKDPDATRSLCEIVEAKGPYMCSSVNVTTADGYILTTFHMQRTTREVKPVVLLWHGLLDNSITWVINMPNQSLPYILADAGYDVWLGNARGNMYGRRHVHWTDKDEEFWQFSWDETAKFDVPNVIDYILNTTGASSLSYVGHSQGTTQMFASLVSGFVAPSKINVYLALAPVTTAGHETNVLFRALANPVVYDALSLVIGKKAFLPTPQQLLPLDEALCRDTPIACEDLIEAFCGVHRGSFNASRMQVMAGHEPGGTSVMNIHHWAQLVSSDRFQKFDYGSKGNMAHYNQTHVPLYNLSHYPTSVPLALFTGNADELADPDDVQVLLERLPMAPVLHQNIVLYAHLDFVWCTTAATDIYLPSILPLLQRYATL